MKSANHHHHHMEFLDSMGIDEIHQAVLKVLSEVGNKVMAPRAIEFVGATRCYSRK